MVIAAFTGVGKSYFADHVESAKDFPLMPYKYTDLGENTVTKAKGERSKADPSHILNPEWPDNYIRAVANQFHDYKYLVIPSDKQMQKMNIEEDMKSVVTQKILFIYLQISGISG